MCLENMIRRIFKVYDKTSGRPVEYEIDYVEKPEFHENCITVRFGIRIKNTDLRSDITLLFYTRMDGTLTGKCLFYRRAIEGLAFKLDLRSIPLHELEEKLYKCS